MGGGSILSVGPQAIAKYLKYLPIRLRRGGRAKMTEATQTTFFSDFFGKEMSENSDLANELITGGPRQNDGG